jgi:guanylate kinase
MNNKKLLVLSSPSGGGKSTIAKELLAKFENLKFSVSATTRAKRDGEINGVQYHFLKKDEFEEKIKSGEFVEYEQIFGNYYGTLKSETDKLLSLGFFVMFDIDVKGAMSIKNHYKDDALLIFISPPDFNTLETRLRKRSTETDEQINIRLSRAELEMSFSDKFDFVVINDSLENAISETIDIVNKNMKSVKI